MYKFSPSTIGLAEDCPKCFWLEHNKGLKRPEGIFPSLPSGMDRILKVHFDSYAAKGELPPEIKDIKDVKVFEDRKLLDIWRNNRQGIVYETEKFKIKGAVDAILKKGDKLIVLDYKTRGYPIKDDSQKYYVGQLALYNYLLRKNGYDTEEYSYLLFYHPDKVLENVFLFHKDLVKVDFDIKFAERLIDKALKLLEGPMPSSSGECSYCKYREAKINSSLLDF
ncbi:MAG: PD-(D/E)XK nuclease family protein [archaeon]